MTEKTPLLEVRNLWVKLPDEEDAIIRGLNLTIYSGEVHALMGPNGSGKSTLAKVLSGHPGYEVTDGEVLFRGENILELEPDERARMGLFLAFQYPMEVPGVTIANFLRLAYQRRFDTEVKYTEFYKILLQHLKKLEMDRQLRRSPRERGVLWRREEALRNRADVAAGACAGSAGRDRFGAGHRRAEDCV
jgi:Fe-S cluster assembly ATP-binding protein